MINFTRRHYHIHTPRLSHSWAMLTYRFCAFARLSTADDGKHYPIGIIMYAPLLYLSFECTSVCSTQTILQFRRSLKMSKACANPAALQRLRGTALTETSRSVSLPCTAVQLMIDTPTLDLDLDLTLHASTIQLMPKSHFSWLTSL